MKFYDDESHECCQCGDYAMPGSYEFTYDGEYFCSRECIAEYIKDNHRDEIEDTEDGFIFDGSIYDSEYPVEEAMIEKYEEDIEEKYIMTAYDHECEYGDIRYDEERDERFFNND